MRRRIASLVVVLLAATAALGAPTVDYQVSLARRLEHLAGVRIHLPAGADTRELQLPVWNALYQVRDFGQYAHEVRAHSAAGQRLAVEKVDKSRWRISGAENGAEVDYQIYADLPGPFGAQLNGEHAFFNLAEVLMYAVDARASPVTISFRDVPPTWAIATPLPPGGHSTSASTYGAANYDRLVDSPVEIGAFTQTFFQQGGATYRVVVHADPADFNLESITASLRQVVVTEVEWMRDRPFDEYLFLLHFPRGPGGAGMEHANACALEISAERMREQPLALTSLAAHEFFHVWNVKRIRPQSLEPVDYTRENYTTALWFSEGLTNTVGTYTLLRMGALDESRWLATLASEIRALEQRPARLTQSVEESSLDAWLEKYPEYQLPERSISYYNKGGIVGVLLDLAIRDATAGRKSLQDVFQWMNRNYAQKKKFFPDTAGVRQAVEAVTGADFREFFEQYVSGVAELPYDRYLATVGLRLERRQAASPYPGFLAARNFDALPVVVRVDANSDAARQGLEPGDTILKINGKLPFGTVDSRVESMRVGETLRLRVSGRAGERDVKFRLGARQEDDYRIVNLEKISAEQRARRAAWLSAEDQGPSAAPGAVRAGVGP
jgi:predicted metalloprotease with PDZ domain